MSLSIDTIERMQDNVTTVKDVILQLYVAGDALGILKFLSSTKEGSVHWHFDIKDLEKLVTRIRRKCSYDCSPLMKSTIIKCCEEMQFEENVSSCKTSKLCNQNDLGIQGSLHSFKKINSIDRNIYSWDPLLLWFRPSGCCIDYIVTQVNDENLNGISSIGCGSGLLEWLLFITSGISVTGYEVNRDWWINSLGPPTFIPHVYADEMDYFPKIPSSHALLFCYFNNGNIFREYLSQYKGPLVIIIGPCNVVRRHTDPLPLDLLGSSEWSLMSVHIQRSTGDIIACYSR